MVHIAAEQGYTQCLLLLYRRGAPLDMKDHAGLTPVDLALQHQKAGMSPLLCVRVRMCGVRAGPTELWCGHMCRVTDSVTLLRLALLSAEEQRGDFEATFAQAFQHFSEDLQRTPSLSASPSIARCNPARTPSYVTRDQRHDTTRHDTTRHDTTRHDTTRQ